MFKEEIKETGFTLIELAIVIAIIGVLMAGAASLAKVHIQQKAYDDTVNRQDEIAAALADFLAEHGRLPCPAPLTAASGTARFGREVTDSCASGNHSGTFRANGPEGRVRIGAVPTRTLNLGDSDGFDAWGQRFTYAVSEELADVNHAFSFANGAIDLVDINNNPVVTPPGKGAFVIVSHGRGGHGGYTDAGVLRHSCDTNARDGENCNNTVRFRAADISHTIGSGRFQNFVLHSLPKNEAVPAGAIMAFDLDECPPGWSEMPNARGRTLVGTGAQDGETYARGETGGSAHYTLSVDEIPPHDHEFILQFSTAPVPTSQPYSGPQPGSSLRRMYSNQIHPPACPDCEDDDPDRTYTNRWMSHVVHAGHPSSGRYRVDLPSSYMRSTGGGEPFDNRPPFLAMLYCKREQ